MSETLAGSATSQVHEDFITLREDCVLLPSLGLSLIEMTGDDRKGWLQGQVTNDLRSLDAGASSAFCLCAATGQLRAVCDIWALPDRFLLTCHADTAAAFMDRVESMVILEDVQARDVTDEYKFVSLQGPAATNILSESIDLPNLDAGETKFKGQPLIALRSNRTGLGGWDLWIPEKSWSKAKSLVADAKEISFEAYDIARLEAGVPRWGVDMNTKTLPPEMGNAFESRHISYKKGCYMGQEVLMRIHSRGHTNKTWVGLLSDAPLPIGAVISHLGKENIGTVTSSAHSPDYGYIAAATIRNEAAFEGEIVKVGDVEAEVRPMPILRFE